MMIKIPFTSGGYQYQQGLTLVEILVALTLGLVVTAMFLQIFAGSKKLYFVQEQSSEIQESGEFALEWLSKYIRLAGYRNDARIEKDGAFLLINNIPNCGQAITLNAGQIIAGRDNVASINNSDCVVFRYQGNNDGSITDCFGTRVNNNNQTVINVLYLDFDNNINDWALRCNSSVRNWLNPQTFVNNVQDMQILYGVDNAAGSIAYLTAAQVTNWNNVVSAKIALLLSSEANVNITNQNQPYYFPPWSNQRLTTNDYRLRRVFTTTINLRN